MSNVFNTSHVLSPPLSPKSQFTKADEVRNTLSEHCPACEDNKLYSICQEFDECYEIATELHDRLKNERKREARLSVILGAFGTERHSACLTCAAAGRIQKWKDERRECDIEISELKAAIAKAEIVRGIIRKEWARECEFLLGEPEKPGPSKRRITVKIPVRNRFIIDLGNRLGSSGRLRSHLLELP